MTVDPFKVKEFKKKLIHGELINKEGESFPNGGKSKDHIVWSFQHLPHEPRPGQSTIELAYWPPKPFSKYGKLRDTDLIQHFNQRPVPSKFSIRGSIAIVGKFENNIVKFFTIDMDNQLAVDTIRERFIPVLDSHGIDYIWEHSEDLKRGNEKGKLWFLCEAMDFDLLSAFVNLLFSEADIDPRDKELDLELFPTVKYRNVVRLPGGVHLRNKKVYPITWRGSTGSSPDFIMDCFIKASAVSQEYIKARVGDLPKPVAKPRFTRNSKFYFSSRNLPLPDNNLPPVVKKIASNCQAINRVIEESKSNDLINIPGGLHHDALLYLWRLGLYNDARVHHNSKIKSTEGEEWIRRFSFDNRDRPWDSHGCESDKLDFLANPERYFPSCKAWEKFDYCEGCPFKDRTGFTSPRQLWHGFNIVKRKVADVKLCTPDDIRQDTFKRVKSRVLQCVNETLHKDILVASPQGSGKSHMVAELAATLASMNRTVLIACPTGDIAIQYKKWIEDVFHQKAFVVLSHNNLFKKLNPGFDCPQEAEIQRLYDLGVSSSVWKSAYCKQCPFAEECPYPNQYRDLGFGENRIIIIQHAHFTCKETLYSIMQKQYDVMFIDESFIDSCHKNIKPKQLELEILETFQVEIPWVEPVLSWLRNGGYAKKEGDKTKIIPTETQLELIRAKMDEHQCVWKVPDYLRYFNINMYLDRHLGFEMFYPLPDTVPVRVFTDATPPLEYLKTVLDKNDIEVFGDDEVLDFRRLNQENKVIQVLDGSMSKSALKGLRDEATEDYTYDRFIDILQFLADLAKGEHKDKKILLTTYNDGTDDQFKTVAYTFLKRNFPDLDVGFEPPHQICISHMMIGTNMFEDYLVQILAAGIYRNGRQLREEVYQLRSIQNFWNRLKDRAITPNPFPRNVGNESSIEREEEPVKKILSIGPRAGVFAFDDFKYRRPADPDFNVIEKFAIARTQQSIRLRFNDDRKRIVYIFGNYFFPSFLMTDCVLEDDILGYIRRQDL